MISMESFCLPFIPALFYFILLVLDYRSYRNKLEKKLFKKKKSNVIKLYNENYPFCGGKFIEPEDLIKKESK